MHDAIPRRRFLVVVGGAMAATGLGVRPGERGLLSPAQAAQAVGAPFPIDDDLAARVLDAARGGGAPFAEIYLERRVVTSLSLVSSRIESVSQGVVAGAGVRAVDGTRAGYAYADSFDPEALVDAGRAAAAIAARGAHASEITFATRSIPRTVRYRRPLTEVGADERVTWLAAADEAARAHDPAITQVTVDHTDEMHHFAVINSEGLWVEDRLPLVYFRVSAHATRGEAWGLGADRRSRRLGAEQMDGGVADDAGITAARMAVANLDARPAPAGEMPVVLGAGGGVLFHEAVGHGLEGDFAMRGTSTYTGRVGEQVGSERVSVMDTGARAELRGSYNVDDEGIVPRENLLIEGGRLRGFLTDRIAAEALNAPRTGNGRRESYRHPPLVRMSNTFILPGEDDAETMIRETRRGLYAASLGGGEVDIATGDFTFGVREGYLIEDGAITAPVRGANLVGNGPEILRRIDRVAADTAFWVGSCGKGQWVPVTCGAPTLRISRMTVGGSET